MSERRPRDIGPTLDAWMDRVAPRQAPGRLLEATFAHTMRSKQARVYPWHRVPIDGVRRQSIGSQRLLVLVIAIALLVAALGVGVGGGAFRVITPTIPSPSASPRASPSPSTSPTPTPVGPPPIAVAPEATIPVEGVQQVVSAGPDLWALAPGRLDRIDTTTNTVTGSVAIGSTTDLYNGLAWGLDALWATNSDAKLLYRVDPAALTLVAEIEAGFAPKGVLATPEGVWVADVHGGTVLRVDPATNKVADTVEVGPIGASGPNWLGDGLGSIWVSIPNNGTVTRFDPSALQIQAAIATPKGFTPCGDFAIEPEVVWLTSCSAAKLMARIDPVSNTSETTLDLGGYGGDPAVINGAPWLTVDQGTPESGTLVRINSATNAIDRALSPGTSFGGGGDILEAAGSVWVADGYHGVVLRLPMAAFAP